jgi:hypothetical protein
MICLRVKQGDCQYPCLIRSKAQEISRRELPYSKTKNHCNEQVGPHRTFMQQPHSAEFIIHEIVERVNLLRAVIVPMQVTPVVANLV